MAATETGPAGKPRLLALVTGILLLFLYPLVEPLRSGRYVLGTLLQALVLVPVLTPLGWLNELERKLRRSERAKGVVLLLSSLVITLGGLEYLARGLAGVGLVEPYSAMRTMLPEGTEDWRMAHLTADRHRQPDPELLWRPVDREPYNRQRFKGPLMDPDKSAGAFRIFAYGDSNTDGPDVGGWTELLGQRLAARPDGERFEVINAGVTGYSSYQGRLRFARDAPRYRPDVVLVSFGWNDLAPALGAPDSSFRPPAAPLVAAQRLLLRYEFFLVARRYWPRGDPPPSVGPRVSRQEYGDNLRAFVGIAAEHGGRVVLLTRPHRDPGPALAARTDDWRHQVPAYNRTVRRVAGRTRAKLVDVQRRFDRRRELFVDECHFNAAGHQRMAELLERQLAARDLLPPLDAGADAPQSGAEG